jgi:hypothetical protein
MADSGNNLILLIMRTTLMIQKNIRFGLSTDGMSPFGEIRYPHLTWSIIMCIFNLPPWLCHKQKYLLLTTLISGPKQAGNDIDVFLKPLMEDMQKIWEHIY